MGYLLQRLSAWYSNIGSGHFLYPFLHPEKAGTPYVLQPMTYFRLT